MTRPCQAVVALGRTSSQHLFAATHLHTWMSSSPIEIDDSYSSYGRPYERGQGWKYTHQEDGDHGGPQAHYHVLQKEVQSHGPHII